MVLLVLKALVCIPHVAATQCWQAPQQAADSNCSCCCMWPHLHQQRITCSPFAGAGPHLRMAPGVDVSVLWQQHSSRNADKPGQDNLLQNVERSPLENGDCKM